MIAAIQPIGLAGGAGAACPVRFVHASLVSTLAAWRRRACSIALGNCGHVGAHGALACRRQVSPFRAERTRLGVQDFADYLRNRPGPIVPDEAAIADYYGLAKPVRIWPIHQPVVEPSHSVGLLQDARTAPVGYFLDIII